MNQRPPECINMGKVIAANHEGFPNNVIYKWVNIVGGNWMKSNLLLCKMSWLDFILLDGLEILTEIVDGNCSVVFTQVSLHSWNCLSCHAAVNICWGIVVHWQGLLKHSMSDSIAPFRVPWWWTRMRWLLSPFWNTPSFLKLMMTLSCSHFCHFTSKFRSQSL